MLTATTIFNAVAYYLHMSTTQTLNVLDYKWLRFGDQFRTPPAIFLGAFSTAVCPNKYHFKISDDLSTAKYYNIIRQALYERFEQGTAYSQLQNKV